MLFGTDAGQNFGKFSNRRLDALARLGGTTSNLDQRIAIYREIEEILLREVPSIPLVWRVELDAMPERLQNFRPNPTAVQDTWNVAAWWLSD